MMFGILDVAYFQPRQKITVEELKIQCAVHIENVKPKNFLVPKLDRVTLEEIESVAVFTTEEPGELAILAAREILDRQQLEGHQLSVIIDFSTTAKDFNGISLVYKIQAQLNARHALTLAVNNGSCSSFHLALLVAQSLFNTNPNYLYILLVSEDRVKGSRYQPGLHIVGDGSSAMLLNKNNPLNNITDIEFHSEGKFSNLMGINHWQQNNIDINGIINKISALHFKVIFDLGNKILSRNELQWKDIDLVLYQNMSKNDMDSFAKGFGIVPERFFTDGLKGHGHIFGSDLVINYCLALQQGKIKTGGRIMMISSGAGFSWGVSLLNGKPLNTTS